jgi:hypothetical protein
MAGDRPDTAGTVMANLVEIVPVLMVEMVANWLTAVHPAFMDLTSK